MVSYLIFGNLPAILLLVPCCFVLAPYWFHVLPCILLIPGIISTVIFACLTAFTEPGYLPDSAAQKEFTQQLLQGVRGREANLYSSTQYTKSFSIQQQAADPNCRFQNSTFYRELCKTTAATQRAITASGNAIQLAMCLHCQQVQPLKTFHSKQSGLCCQRFDHHCVALGADIGLRNHYYFFCLLIIQAFQQFTTLIYAFLVMVVGSHAINDCPINVDIFTDTGSYFCHQLATYKLAGSYITRDVVVACLVLSLLIMGGSVAGTYSAVTQLRIQVRQMLKGQMLWERSPMPTQQSIIYSALSPLKSVQILRQNTKAHSIIQSYFRNCNMVMNIARSHPLVIDMQSLEKVIRQDGRIDCRYLSQAGCFAVALENSYCDVRLHRECAEAICQEQAQRGWQYFRKPIRTLCGRFE